MVLDGERESFEICAKILGGLMAMASVWEVLLMSCRPQSNRTMSGAKLVSVEAAAVIQHYSRVAALHVGITDADP